MQTAVEWLIEQLQAPCRGIPSHIIEQAKQMEKEQIINAFDEGLDDRFYGFSDRSEQYYNETYGSKGSDVTASQLKISDSCIPPESFTLSLDREEPPIIVIDKEGFMYKGELVEDKGEIYKLFKNYLTSSQFEQAKKMENQQKGFNEEEVYKLLCSMPNFFNMTIPEQIEAREQWYREQLKSRQ